MFLKFNPPVPKYLKRYEASDFPELEFPSEGPRYFEWMLANNYTLEVDPAFGEAILNRDSRFAEVDDPNANIESLDDANSSAESDEKSAETAAPPIDEVD